MSSPAFAMLPGTFIQTIGAPPGLAPPTGLYAHPAFAPVEARADSGGKVSDHTSIGSASSTDEGQSDTASSVCEGELISPSSPLRVPVSTTAQTAPSTEARLDMRHIETERKYETKLQVDAPAFVPMDRKPRTALQTCAQEFTPKLPFVPMSEVENAWRQWHVARTHGAVEPSCDMAAPRKPKKQTRRRLPKKQ